MNLAVLNPPCFRECDATRLVVVGVAVTTAGQTMNIKISRYMSTDAQYTPCSVRLNIMAIYVVLPLEQTTLALVVVRFVLFRHVKTPLVLRLVRATQRPVFFYEYDPYLVPGMMFCCVSLMFHPRSFCHSINAQHLFLLLNY